MDIGLMSMMLSNVGVQQQASISVMKQAMDISEGNADFINKMLGSSDIQALQHVAQPHLGGNIDIKG